MRKRLIGQPFPLPNKSLDKINKFMQPFIYLSGDFKTLVKCNCHKRGD